MTTSADTVAIGGQVFDREGDQHLAVVTVRWVNKGSFTSNGWSQTILAKMIGWEAAREAVFPCSENIAYEHIGKNCFRAYENMISYMTPGTIKIDSNAWHSGCLVFPVNPA